MHKDCENYPQTGQSSSDSFTQTLKLSTTVMIIIDFSGPASYPPLPVTGVSDFPLMESHHFLSTQVNCPI